MSSLILRFDIDTPRCLKEGVPNLLRLAKEEDVHFTFFCNMGRAVSRSALLKKLLLPSSTSMGAVDARKLPAAAKLTPKHMMTTLLLNPLVGMSYPGVLHRAQVDGHDIGLHGGSNHGTWQHGFRNWREDRIRREVALGMRMFEAVLGEPPALFSSPGWQGSDELNAILKSMGFLCSADRHGPHENDLVHERGFCTFPTNLVAEPGGVAYFESFAARGLTDADVIRQFRSTIEDDRQLYVLYDHPCFAGIAALEIVRSVVRQARDSGLNITTISRLLPRESSS